MSPVSWLWGGVDPGAGVLAWTGPRWLVAAAVGTSVAVLLVAWASARGVRGRGLQALLLAPALAALCLALARPVLREGSERWEAGRFVVLVDDSRSMAVQEGRGPRSDAVAGILTAVGHPEAERFVFGGDLALGADPTWDAEDTDLGVALQAVRDRYAGERLAGLVVVTDGIDRGSLGTAWRTTGTVDPPDLPGPLTVYGVGSSSDLVDLAVEDVQVGGFAFIRAPFSLKARIAGPGFERRTFPVALKRDGALVERREVVLDGQGRAEIAFEVQPGDVGRHTWEVELPVPPGDAVTGNNTEAVVVRVVRDRMRVLQVCGAPSMDEKFLRRFLKQDPAVDLVSFFILRTHADMGAGWADDELALIPFPYEELFGSRLDSFDLVIFQNFDYAPYFGWRAEDLLVNLADWVRRGGAFAMIGGDRSFDLGGYAGTPIEDVLPVRLGAPDPTVDPAPLQPVLTDAGARHPITALAAGRAASAEAWAALPALDGVHLAAGMAPGAAVLLAHPTRTAADGSSAPVVAVRTVGEGRSLALLGDSSWRWAFAEAGRGHGNQAYLRFWKQAMRWLVGDPDAQRVVVETSRENYGVGDEVRIAVRVRDVGFQPMAGVRVRARVAEPGVAGEPDAEEVLTGPDGEAVVAFRGRRPGAHRVRVEALGEDGTPFFQGATVFAVTAREAELEQIAPDHAFLAALAAAVGGRWVPPGTALPPLEDPAGGRLVRDVRETPLWHVPLLALVVGLSVSLSWWVRRRGGGR